MYQKLAHNHAALPLRLPLGSKGQLNFLQCGNIFQILELLGSACTEDVLSTFGPNIRRMMMIETKPNNQQ